MSFRIRLSRHGSSGGTGLVAGKADTAPNHPPAFAEIIVDEGKPEPKPALPLRVVLRSVVSFEIVSAEQLPLAVGLIQSLAGIRSCCALGQPAGLPGAGAV